MAKGETSKYECPDDFVSSRRPLTDLLKGNESEVWLVKTPAGFEPRSLHGVEVNLCGFQTLTLPSAGDASDGQPVYNILASDHGTADLRLLAAGSAAVGPAFCGLLSVYESYGSAGAPPPVARAAPAPTIPPGLKQRFRPFGSETPITTRETRDQDGKTKKKKKKDERIKAEPGDLEVTVKQEVEEPAQEHREDKKRKKKEKEELVQVKQEVESEQEVADAWYKNDGSAKKKKKKEKKIKKDDD
ncbi:CD3e molecule, epsilon associated protein [Phycodurus eques]|uniref:CD3e molecule, epsilon associated protein n=1 Tax=Phycodurus eques TaxID=693459 RepID=UPI002ACED13D|nr:CD3e molecule, epsilon associated protein [Phycodurus eques]